VCIAVTQVEFDQDDPNKTSDDPNILTVTHSSQPCVVTFNARDPNGNACGATNRATTWGRLKTTYR
jgi:hypothetical protein